MNRVILLDFEEKDKEYLEKEKLRLFYLIRLISKNFQLSFQKLRLFSFK
jgi:hypothetical protein